MGKVVNKIPEKMKEYMENEKINQSELSRRLKIDRSTTSLLIRGERGQYMQFDILNRICQTLKVTPNDLLWEEED